MPKRLTDTDKWKDPWFCALTIPDRLFWIYLCDNCDHAGIWQVNPLLVNTYFPGFQIDASRFGNRVQQLENDKWFITKFMPFQYGNRLNKGDAVNGAIKRIESLGLKDSLERVLGESIESLMSPKAKAMAIDVEVKEGPREELHLAQEVWFEQLWKEYPAAGRIRKKEAYRRFCGSVKDEETYQRCAAALAKYVQSKRVLEGVIQNASTWFNDWESWESMEEQVSNVPAHML